jgi:hypothetical protein
VLSLEEGLERYVVVVESGDSEMSSEMLGSYLSNFEIGRSYTDASCTKLEGR